ALTACDPAGPGAPPSPSASETGTATPTPTPTPTPVAAPTLGEMMLTADGMGTLVFGEPPSADPVLQMVAEDPAACSEFAPAGTPEATRWRPIAAYDVGGYPTFGVAVTDGNLERIDLYDSTIPADGGIRIGDTLDAVTAAHPDASIVHSGLTDIHVVTGVRGTLQIEVARADSTGYWPASDIGHVMYIHAAVTGYGTFTVAASENIAGGCL
ncbi:MAG TPA: hypothetical protein VF479_06385, partial [Pseudolysinimonas sp.]